MRRLSPLLPAALLLPLLGSLGSGGAAAATAPTSSSATPATSAASGSGNRFGPRRLAYGGHDIFVDARRDLVAVRYPDDAPRAGSRDAATVGAAVYDLLRKLGRPAGVSRAWVLQSHGTVAVALSRAVDAATLGRLADLVRADGGHLWPVLARGPADDVDAGDEVSRPGRDREPSGRAFADDHLVVTAAPGQLDMVLARALPKLDGTLVRRSAWLADTAVVAVGAAVNFDAVDAAALLADVDGVRAAEPLLYRELQLREAVNDPLYPSQWHLSRAEEPAASVPGTGTIHADDAWLATRGDPAVVAAVFDSGTDWQHPDLLPNVRQDLMFDTATGDGDPTPECQQSQDGAAEVPNCPSSAPYVESHGTSVSGAIAARGDNGVGVTGVCPECALMPVRLLGEAAVPALSTAEAFDRACDPTNDGAGAGAWLINNSWGPGFSLYFPLSTAERDAFETCRTIGRGGKGAVILFAAGNSTANVRKDAYAKHPTVIAVAASTNLDDWAAYSNYGNEVDIAAPSLGGSVEEDNYGIVTTDVQGGDRGYSVNGTNVDGSDIDVDYNPGFSGTSAASPVAAGVVGLILSVNPDLTAEQVRLVLTRTATKILADKVDWESFFGQDLAAIFAYDDTGHSIAFGYGRVDAAAAVALAADPAALGVAGQACTADGVECAICDEQLGRCLQPCTAQTDCADGSVCDVATGACALPVERPGDFLAPCTDACTRCVATLDTGFAPTSVCSIECAVDSDCDPACADDPENCQPDGFDCRPATDDPNGPKVCAIGDPGAGGPADFNSCFNGQIGTSVVVVSGEGRELCGDLCFDDAPASCAYGFHCAEVTCSCTRNTNFGCFEFTCAETSAGNGDFFFPVCVPDEGHADRCTGDFDCQFGDYCADIVDGVGRCHVDDRGGCDVCQPCTDSSECSGRGVCIGTNNGQNPGVCSVACDDGEACPGDSTCREFQSRRGPVLACLGTADDFEGATAVDLCADFTCTVPCRDDVPCGGGQVCVDSACVDPPPSPVDDAADLTFAGGGLHCGGCQSGPDPSLPFGLALLALLGRRRRR
jgi:MYXO-CTERM domain-containing protein